MATRTFVLPLQVTAKQYAGAVRQRRDGNLNASPVAVALTEQGVYMLAGQFRKQITVMEIATGQHYSGPTPKGLEDYLAGFRRGARISVDHEFELMLVSDDE